MRVFTAALATETNTFAPMPTGLAAFKERGYYAAGTHPNHLTFFAGPLWAARLRAAERGWQVTEGMVAAAQPSGTTTRHAYETLRDELLADLKAALPVDMVLLGLHGAMVAEGYDDCEGDLLQRVRAIVGPAVVVGAELDPHTHLSAAMVEHADLLVAFKEYPHTDVLPRALELADLCEAMVQKRIRPVAAVVDCHMIVALHTPQPPMRAYVDKLMALEGQNGILHISLIHGFPRGDAPDMGTKLLVYADGDAAQAQALAQRLADELVAMREQFEHPPTSMDEALDQALATHASHTPGPVVLADRSDNPGSGAPGDATFLLRRMLERGITQACVGPLWDPLAAHIASEAGVGAKLALRMGGKVGPDSGDPVDAWVEVKALVPNMHMTGLANTPMAMGDCALVETAGIQIVLTSQRNQAMGTDLFTQLGCDLQAQRIVVVKSAQHFYAAFAPIAQRVIYVDAPGTATHDLRQLDFKKIQRPKWPLDL